MVNKFIVFVVVAIVAQSSVLLTSASVDEFPEDSIALLDLLQSNNLAALTQIFIGVGGFIDLLKNGTSETSSPQDLSPFAESLITAAEATDIVYYSALLVGQGDCNGIDIALNQSRAQLQGVIETIVGAIAMAQGGNYDNNRHEIENNRTSTLAGFISAYTTMFDFLRCCISDSSDEVENMLKAVEAKVCLDFELMNNAFYEAIEAYSILTSECTEDEAAAALLSLEKSRYDIISPAVDIIENVISVYETIHIVALLNCSDITYGVFEIRLARKRTSDKLSETMKVIFIAILGRLRQHSGHGEIESRNSTLDDPTQHIAVELIQGAEAHFLEVVLRTLSNSTDDAIVAQILLPPILTEIISLYYNEMDLAEAESFPLHLSLLAIKYDAELQALLTKFVVEICFKIIGNDARTEETLAYLQNIVTDSLQEANEAAAAAIEVLSRVAHGTYGASEDDLNKVHSLMLDAIAGVSNAARVQFHAVLYKYLIESGY